MAKEGENRVFVGGLSWEVTERQLEDAFRRFGKITDCQIMVDRDSGRPRGFGFLTFADRRGMEDAIRDMHGRELGDRVISVNKAEPKPGENTGHGYGGSSYSSAPRGGYRGSDRPDRADRMDECFKCGRPGHWARDCPSSGGGRGSDAPFSRSRYGDPGSRVDRFGDRDRYIDDPYDGGRYGDRDRLDSRDKYAARDRYVSDRYPPAEDRYVGDRYRGSDRYPTNGYGRERPYDRDVAPRRGADKYGGGGPMRGVGRTYADRAGPYDRPARGGRPSSYERY